MRSRKWMWLAERARDRVQMWEQERQAGGVCDKCCDSFSLSKQPCVTTYLEKVKQNFGSVKHFQKTLSAVSTLKMKYNLAKRNGHHRYYRDVVLHSQDCKVSYIRTGIKFCFQSLLLFMSQRTNCLTRDKQEKLNLGSPVQ